MSNNAKSLYPVVPWYNLLYFLSFLTLGVPFALTAIGGYGCAPLVLSWLVSAAFISCSVSVFVRKYIKRRKKLDRVIYTSGGALVSAGTDDEIWKYKMKIKYLDNKDFFDDFYNVVLLALRTYYGSDFDGSAFENKFVWLEILPQGEVFLEYAGKRKRVRGTLQGNYGQVEWLDPMATRKLLMHETAHWVMDQIGIHKSEQEQHRIMRETLSV